MPSTEARRIIRLPEVMNMTGLGKTTIYGRISDHTFPAPIKLGRASGWVEADVQQWIETQIAASREKH